jgi:GTPase SAR1 family protein
MALAEKKDFYLFRIMTLGNDGVGKTTLYYTFMGEPDKTKIIWDVGYKDIFGIGGKRMVKMEMTNPPKAKDMLMIDRHIKNRIAFLLMFDVTDDTSFLIRYG